MRRVPKWKAFPNSAVSLLRETSPGLMFNKLNYNFTLPPYPNADFSLGGKEVYKREAEQTLKMKKQEGSNGWEWKRARESQEFEECESHILDVEENTWWWAGTQAGLQLSGSKETALSIPAARGKADELGWGRRSNTPPKRSSVKGQGSKERTLMSKARQQEAAPGGPGTSANMAARRLPGAGCTLPGARRQGSGPRPLGSGRALSRSLGTGDTQGWRRGPSLRRRCAPCLLAPGRRGPCAMPSQAPPGQGLAEAESDQRPPTAVPLALPWPAAALAPRPSRCRYHWGARKARTLGAAGCWRSPTLAGDRR